MSPKGRIAVVVILGIVLLAFGIFRAIAGGHDVAGLGYGSIIFGAIALVAAAVMARRAR